MGVTRIGCSSVAGSCAPGAVVVSFNYRVGALGFLAVNGTADLSVVIRTLVAASGGLSIGAGGAIVAGSDPRDELAEMLLKARPLLEAVGGSLATGSTAPDPQRTVQPIERTAPPRRSLQAPPPRDYDRRAGRSG